MKKYLDKIKSLFKFKSSKKSTFRFREVVILIGLTLVISSTFGLFIGYKLNNKKAISLEENKSVQEFLENYQYIIDNYYGDIDEDELLDSAIKGVLDALGDPFSSYIDSGDTNFDISLNGGFEGIGVALVVDAEGYIKIQAVLENSPAKTIGLMANDIILTVNGIDFKNKEASSLSAYVRENKGPYTIKVKRGTEEKIFITNKTYIEISSVKHEMFEVKGRKVGYISVSIFAANTYKQFKLALDDLKAKGMESLIIDLRNNSGGHLSAVKSMSSLFLASNKIVYQTENKSGIEKIYSSGSANANYPIVILANGNSASASEVMIGALTENINATFIGEKTYGKGTVQELQDLPDGSSYKFTIKKWLTPTGNWIHGKGIVPTKEVVLSAEYNLNPIQKNDNQLQNAITHLVP